MKTTLPVKILVDLMTVTGEKFDALLPMTIEIYGDELVVGSFNGPDMWRAKLSEITTRDT
jgi:hypothetical protein